MITICVGCDWIVIYISYSNCISTHLLNYLSLILEKISFSTENLNDFKIDNNITNVTLSWKILIIFNFHHKNLIKSTNSYFLEGVMNLKPIKVYFSRKLKIYKEGGFN